MEWFQLLAQSGEQNAIMLFVWSRESYWFCMVMRTQTLKRTININIYLPVDDGGDEGNGDRDGGKGQCWFCMAAAIFIRATYIKLCVWLEHCWFFWSLFLTGNALLATNIYLYKRARVHTRGMWERAKERMTKKTAFFRSEIILNEHTRIFFVCAYVWCNFKSQTIFGNFQTRSKKN